MTAASLFPVVRDTRRRLYCGPTAICATTGRTAAEVLFAIDRRRGDAARNAAGRLKGVRGMSRDELVAILKRLGFGVVHGKLETEPTFAAYLRDVPNRFTPENPRIIHVRGHFLAVGPFGRDVCDTFTKQPVAAADAPRRRARVTDEIIIRRKA